MLHPSHLNLDRLEDCARIDPKECERLMYTFGYAPTQPNLVLEIANLSREDKSKRDVLLLDREPALALIAYAKLQTIAPESLVSQYDFVQKAVNIRRALPTKLPLTASQETYNKQRQLLKELHQEVEEKLKTLARAVIVARSKEHCRK